jgi:predicted nucleic acid-binding protein
VRFWDSSALVPLLVTEAATAAREKQVEADPAMLVWWGTPVECASALQRLGREGALQRDDSTAAEKRLRLFEQLWIEVEPTQAVRRQAERLLRLHPLRAADALQLAAALVACHHEPATLAFVTAAATPGRGGAPRGLRGRAVSRRFLKRAARKPSA